MSVVEIFPRLAKTSKNTDAGREQTEGEHDYGSLLVILSGSVVERCRLTRRRMYIGRGVNSDLRLNSKYVSVNHAMVVHEDSLLYIVDLHSKNKTIVNGEPEQKKALRHGDMILLGEFMLRYEAPKALPALKTSNHAHKADDSASTTTPSLPELPAAGSPAELPRTATAEPAAARPPHEGQTMLVRGLQPPEPLASPPETISTAPPKRSAPNDAAPKVTAAPTSVPKRGTAPSAAASTTPSAREREPVPVPELTRRPEPATAPATAVPKSAPPATTPTVPESAAAPSASRVAEAARAVEPARTALDETALAVAIAEAARDGRSPLDVLEATAGLDVPTLTAELARVFAYAHLQARDLMALDADFEQLPAAEARRRGCVVVRANRVATAVISDPFDADLRPWLEARVAGPLRWALVARGDLNAFISKHEQNLRAIDTALKGAHGELSKDSDIEELSLASIGRDQSPVVKLVRSTLFDALRANASDVHLEAGNAQLEIRYRLDGVLVQVASVPGTEIAEQVISRVKVMSELDIAERRVPQDGRFKSSFNGRAIDFRVSIMPSTYGEDAVLRVLDKQAITDQMSELTIDGLGFERGVVASLRHLSTLPHGMLLVTGPTGSGKTTTLYAAISETNTGRDKIVTIEDPVEYQLPGVLQIPVNEKKGLTFARGLRSILRHDPDKIMVGEIRDPETAQIAVQSALTGHLVFTTVHANNVFDVLSRFTHMGVDVYSFVAALNGILAQRLLRIICDSCSEPIDASNEMLAATGLPLEEARQFRWHIGRGCSRCRGTGYRGRRAVGELLVLNDELREAIVARVPVRQLKELAHKNHVRLIRSVALDLVRDGLSTIEEVNRVTAVS